jgi:hypothetical protein
MANLTGAKGDNKGLFFVKDPDANIVYGIDWTDYLGSATITAKDVTIETITGDSAALQFPTDESTDVTVSGKQVNIRLSGGTVGNEYNVDCKITTNGGDTDSRRFRIVIKRKHL